MDSSSSDNSEPPKLSITDLEINEIIKHLGLTTISTNGTVNTSGVQTPSNLIDFISLISELELGDVSARNNKNPNELLGKGLNSVRDFIFFLKEAWILQASDPFDPYFEEVLSISQIMAIIDFIDLDRSGTLELAELQNAFRVCSRFSEKQMRIDGAATVLKICLPFLRSRGIRLNDFLQVREGGEAREFIGQAAGAAERS